MADRTCIHCGYELTGLARREHLVICPECGQANDLRAPFWLRVSTAKPYLWGMVPVGVSVVGTWAARALGVTARTLGVIAELMVLLASVIGAIMAGVLMSEMIAREAALGNPARPGWQRFLLVICAGASMLIINGVLSVMLIQLVLIG